MSLRKVGKYYWLDIRLAGKRIRRSLHADNKNIAFQKFRDLRDKLIAEYKKEDIRFEDFIKKHMEWAWNEKPASALREQQRLKKINAFFNTLGIYLSEISPYHIEQLKAELKIRKLSKSTITRYLQILRGMFYKAIAWDVYHGINPLKKVKFLKESPQITPLTDVQVKKILAFAKEISRHPYSPIQKCFYDIVLLALNTGLRKSEVLNLKWKDIRKDEIEVKGKGDKVRKAPLNNVALKIINSQQQSEKYVFNILNRHQHDLLRRTISQERKRTEINHLHFHLFRHYFTTKLVENSIDLVTISEILGHSSRITSLIYAHTNKEKMRKAVDLLI